MAAKVEKATLDGKTKFEIGSRTYTWSDLYLERVAPYSLDPAHTYTVNLTFKGKDWFMEGMSFKWGSTSVRAVITDDDNASGRGIKFLELDDAGGEITLKSTWIGHIAGNDGVEDITLGSAGSETLVLRGGNDSVTGTSGECASINLGDGKNSFKSGNMWAGAVIADDGNDAMTVNGRGKAEALIAGKGNNTFNVTGSGWVGLMSAHDGDDTVRIASSKGADSIRLGDGDNTLIGTGNGWIGHVLAFDGDDNVKLSGATAEFAGSFALGRGNNLVTTGVTFVESISTNSGKDTFDIGSGGADQIVSSGNGNDTLTSIGRIGSILFGGGKDSITLLAGGSALSAMLRGGNDRLSVSEVLDAETKSQTCMFNGGDGNDTISFAQFTHAVDIDLGSSDAFDTGHGKFIAAKFEKLIGGGAADTLQGQGDGSTLTGNGGGDTFAFADGDGAISVTDFAISEGDKIDLSGVTGIDDFNDLSTNHISQDGDDAEITSANGDVLKMLDINKENLTADQFEF